jgi:hypothetical protein
MSTLSQARSNNNIKKYVKDFIHDFELGQVLKHEVTLDRECGQAVRHKHILWRIKHMRKIHNRNSEFMT